MLFSSFGAFKKRESRGFNYVPRHYNPEEDPETYGRRKLGQEKEAFLRKEKFKNKMREEWGTTLMKHDRSQHRVGITRLLILLILAVGVIYFMSDVTDSFFKVFDK